MNLSRCISEDPGYDEVLPYSKLNTQWAPENEIVGHEKSIMIEIIALDALTACG